MLRGQVAEVAVAVAAGVAPGLVAVEGCWAINSQTPAERFAAVAVGRRLFCMLLGRTIEI